jgi:hypothetical protein
VIFFLVCIILPHKFTSPAYVKSWCVSFSPSPSLYQSPGLCVTFGSTVFFSCLIMMVPCLALEQENHSLLTAWLFIQYIYSHRPYLEAISYVENCVSCTFSWKWWAKVVTNTNIYEQRVLHRTLHNLRCPKTFFWSSTFYLRNFVTNSRFCNVTI